MTEEEYLLQAYLPEVENIIRDLSGENGLQMQGELPPGLHQLILEIADGEPPRLTYIG